MNGDEILPNNPADPITEEQTVVDSIKAMVGFWTEQYISALGNGSGGGSSTGALVDLTDVSISNPTDGQALVYDAATTHWKNATVAGSYTLPIATSSVLGGIKVGTTLQINSTTGVLDIASGYATQSWVTTQLGSYLPLSGGTLSGSLYTNSNICIGTNSANYLLSLVNTNNGWGVSMGSANNRTILAHNSYYGIQVASRSSSADYWLAEYKYGVETDFSNGNIAFKILCNGNVGIGVSSPTHTLEVNGDTYATSFIKSGSSNDYVLLGGGGHSQLKTINGYSIFGTGDISVSGGGGGNYLPLSGGIMTGRTYFNQTGAFYQFGISSQFIIGSNYNENFYMWSSDSSSRLSLGTNSNERLTILPSGYVGINSNSPSRTFYVNNLTQDWTVGFHSTNCDLSFSHYAGYGLAIRSYTTSNSIYLIEARNNYDSSYDASFVLIAKADGKIGMSIKNPSYTLHVGGDICATGGVTALSDARHKTIIQDTQLSVEQIAGMPAVEYRWNDGREDNGLHVGSIAQDWQRVLPQVVLTANDAEHTLSMQYGVAALISAITIARKVVNHEQRLTQLEKENAQFRAENAQFRAENAQLRAEISKLKAA